MFCKNCGNELDDKYAFCSNCGSKVDDGFTEGNTNTSGGASSNKFHCPRCKSTNLSVISSAEISATSKGGFSACKGFFGYLCLGPLGILCGACGKNKVKTKVKNDTAWVCKNCSHRFKDLYTVEEELEVVKAKANTLKRVHSVLFPFSILAEVIATLVFISGVIAIITGTGSIVPRELGISLLVVVILAIFVGIAYSLKDWNGITQDVEELEKLRDYIKTNCYDE